MRQSASNMLWAAFNAAKKLGQYFDLAPPRRWERPMPNMACLRSSKHLSL